MPAPPMQAPPVPAPPMPAPPMQAPPVPVSPAALFHPDTALATEKLTIVSFSVAALGLCRARRGRCECVSAAGHVFAAGLGGSCTAIRMPALRPGCVSRPELAFHGPHGRRWPGRPARFRVAGEGEGCVGCVGDARSGTIGFVVARRRSLVVSGEGLCQSPGGWTGRGGCRGRIGHGGADRPGGGGEPPQPGGPRGGCGCAVDGGQWWLCIYRGHHRAADVRRALSSLGRAHRDAGAGGAGWRIRTPIATPLADAGRDFVQADGRTVSYPTRASTPAGDWLRKNPRLHPLGQLRLVDRGAGGGRRGTAARHWKSGRRRWIYGGG